MISARDLEQVYTEHGNAVFAYLLNLSRSESVSQDLLHELFLKLSQRSSLAWRLVRHKRRYLLRSAYCLFIDHCRREKLRAQTLDDFGNHSHLFESTPANDANGELVTEWLGKLPADQRSIVHLKIWEELTFREIAKLLDIPPDTAASRYRYALDKLRAMQRQSTKDHA
ncbi:MAG: sigma-70 family RNA polymerase sigma factor [Verrucomicrobiales bacterium]|jgi:RNA polymerase sigma-70 factor (ECF subfamily)|nr:sigma-70 family RNA polymerase sigma factor [Verrucomicrobiales bacterium]